MERITIPTRHSDDVTIKTTSADARCVLDVGNGAVEIHVDHINVRRCPNHTAVYIHVESCGSEACAASLSLDHGIARRLAVWLSHHTDRIAE